MKPLKTFRLLLLGSIPIVLVLLYQQTDLPEYRHLPLNRFYHAIFLTKSDIDFLFLGGSRNSLAINAKYWQKIHKISTGKNTVVYDLPLKSTSLAIDYFLLEDLLPQKKIKNIFIEYGSTPFNSIHPHLKIFSPTSDLFEIFWHSRSIPWYEKVKKLPKWLAERFVLHLQYLLQGKSLKLDKNLFPKDRVIDMTSPSGTRAVPYRIQQVLDRSKGKIPSDKKISPLSDDLWLESHYARKIISLAKRHGAQVHMYMAPSFFSASITPSSQEKIIEEFKVPLFIPNQTIRETLFKPKNYYDSVHMRPVGSEIFMDWLHSEFRKNVEQK